MPELIQEREALVARAIALLQESEASSSERFVPEVALKVLDGLTVCSRTDAPAPFTETFRFSVADAAGTTLQVDLQAKGDRCVENRRMTCSPARAFWYSRSVFEEEGKAPRFEIIAITNGHVIRATNDGVSSARVPRSTLPLSALASMIAAMPTLPSEMQFLAFDEQLGRVVPVTYTRLGTKDRKAPFGLGVARVEVVRYDMRVEERVVMAEFLATKPHIWAGGLTGMFYGKANAEV